jgi:SPP1 gp7 family putative phage head morphogenesis protein
MERIQKKLERALVREYSRALKDIRAELAQLYALTDKNLLRYNRLRALEIFIRQNLSEVYRKNAVILNQALEEMYRESYYMTAWAVDMNVGVLLSWGVLNPAVIAAAVMEPIDKLTLNDRLERNRAKVIAAIRHEITQGMLKGEAYEKMARRIKRTLEGDARKARTVARTEAHRIQNRGKFKAAQDAEQMGIDMVKVWDATLDLRTRPAHRYLDGTAVAVNENFRSKTGGNGPVPGLMGTPQDDINCRCTMRLQLKGYSPSVRRIRDEGVVKYRTYQQWAKEKGISMDSRLN